ncbi:unnamed protein product, partial [Ectocarpus sp. 4 AP-2014]
DLPCSVISRRIAARTRGAVAETDSRRRRPVVETTSRHVFKVGATLPSVPLPNPFSSSQPLESGESWPLLFVFSPLMCHLLLAMIDPFTPPPPEKTNKHAPVANNSG